MTAHDHRTSAQMPGTALRSLHNESWGVLLHLAGSILGLAAGCLHLQVTVHDGCGCRAEVDQQVAELERQRRQLTGAARTQAQLSQLESDLARRDQELKVTQLFISKYFENSNCQAMSWKEYELLIQE